MEIFWVNYKTIIKFGFRMMKKIMPRSIIVSYLTDEQFFVLLGALCPSGWFNKGSSCYKISDNRLNWEAAKNACEILDSTLAIISSHSEQQALNPFINTTTWIGLHRQQSNKTLFLWLDGSPPIYTNWGRREPSNIVEECVEMRSFDAAWNDLACSRRHRYICERGTT